MTYVQLVAAHTGVNIIGEDDQRLVVAGLSSKTGTLGAELEPYMALTSEDGDGVDVHPVVAMKLFEAGAGGVYKVDCDAQPKQTTSLTKSAPAAQAQNVQSLPVAGSKKASAIAVYIDDKNGCKDRKHTIDRMMNELGMTKAGAATYYQNCRSQWCV